MLSQHLTHRPTPETPMATRHRRTVAAALAPLGFTFDSTGGDSSAYLRDCGDGRTIYLTAADSAHAPVSMRQRCDCNVWDARTDATRMVVQDMPLGEMIDTVLLPARTVETCALFSL